MELAIISLFPGIMDYSYITESIWAMEQSLITSKGSRSFAVHWRNLVKIRPLALSSININRLLV
mgnify:CR=1 FL=1